MMKQWSCEGNSPSKQIQAAFSRYSVQRLQTFTWKDCLWVEKGNGVSTVKSVLTHLQDSSNMLTGIFVLSVVAQALILLEKPSATSSYRPLENIPEVKTFTSNQYIPLSFTQDIFFHRHLFLGSWEEKLQPNLIPLVGC